MWRSLSLAWMVWLIMAAALGLGPRLARAEAFVDPPQRFTLDPVRATAGAAALAEYRQPRTIPFPAAAPYTPAMARLGRALFFDVRLSSAGTLSCASCHNPALSWAGGVSRVSDAPPRHTPSVANLAWRDSYGWDGRFGTLEEQIFSPLESAAEMHRPRDELPGLLDSLPDYRALLLAAKRGAEFSPALVAQAIATFERTIVYAPTPFDRWVGGDAAALSEAARRGFAVFTGRGGCSLCHSGWNFEDGGFHDIGLSDADPGRGRMMPGVIKLQHAFRTPGLRDISRRAPYMHDASLPTLQAVVEHYDAGGVERPSRAELIHRLGLGVAEKADLVAFLEALTADDAAAVLPQRP